MWYVIQVADGRELSTVQRIKRRVDPAAYRRVFNLERMHRRKRDGAWVDVPEVLFPGYVFVDTKTPDDFCDELAKVPALTKLLENGEGSGRRFVPVSDADMTLLAVLVGGDGRTMDVSEGIIEGGKLVVTNGPLAGLEPLVKKVDRHKRLAWLEADLFGETLTFKVGLEVTSKS